jgi:Glycosyl transferase family 2
MDHESETRLVMAGSSPAPGAVPRMRQKQGELAADPVAGPDPEEDVARRPTNAVLVIVPARSRPAKSVEFAEAFFAHSTCSDLVFGLDGNDDHNYPRLPGVQYEVNPRLRLVGTLNVIARKHMDQYEYLAFMGDDHRIRTPGWDQKLVAAIADLSHGIAYGNDLFMGANLPTTVLMKSSIVRTLGYMAPPSLTHLYSDNFWLDLGSALGSIRYVDDVIIEHMHYILGKAEADELYLDVNSTEMYERDRTAFETYKRDRFAADLELLRAAAKTSESQAAVLHPGTTEENNAFHLTIGIPTHNDFDGVYFTLQALRLYQNLEDTELLVVDNYGCEHTRQFVEGLTNARYILAKETVGTAAAKNRVFAEARGDAVLCCDSHVLFSPGAIARLRKYYRTHPETIDLLQGPLLHGDLETIFTHFDPVWHDEIWGAWATDPRGLDPEGEPFEIPMQGMGVFSCRKDVWPGFHPAFRGFGGEEGYIHEKIRQAGGRCLCLPRLRWVHRFGRPAGVPCPALLNDKVKNYIIGFTELGLDLEPVRSHFAQRLSEEQFAALATEALADARATGSITPAAPDRRQLTAAITSPVDASQVDEAEKGGRSRRALVCFVEDQPHLLQQLLSLHLSWLHTQSPDTDLVVMGPEAVLARLPEDLVKIPQQPAADDPVWGGYRVINAIACLNGSGAEQLERYSYLLRTDLDTFITPAWNQFSPSTITVGIGAYVHDDLVRQRLQDLATEYGLAYQGMTNIGATWYGPTAVVRRAAAFTEMLTKHLLTHDFAMDPGEWPGWYRGVALKYAAEIAINHCAPHAERSVLLDASSASTEPITRIPHIHCQHTDELFSKHAFMAGIYAAVDPDDLDMQVIREYCLGLAVRSVKSLAPVH